MKKYLLSLIIILVSVFSQEILAQTLSPNIPNVAQIRQQLAAKGIKEQDFVTKLRQRGIVLETVDPNDTDQVTVVQKAIQEVITELEQKGAANKSQVGVKKDSTLIEKAGEGKVLTDSEKAAAAKEVSKDTKDISKKVKEGATVEEAVAEKISESVEEKLPPAATWGQEIFRNKSISIYRQSKDVKPPDSYILGAGDQVAVSIWGYSQGNFVFEINEDGYIKPEAMPRINLKGITLGKAKSLLRTRFSEFYRFRPEEFEVSIYFSRTINVNVVGEVFNFGSFSLPATNTAYNALVAAGGPSNIGSVRNIKLKRAGKPDKKIDIYEFLLNPSTQDELYLEENDYIYVPVAEKIVEINGAINRTHKYELVKQEDLKDLIRYAGGLKQRAVLTNCVVKRLEGDKEIFINVILKNVLEDNEKFELKNGDVITINTIDKPFENFLTIEGAVDFPGKYAVSENMRFSSILQKAKVNSETDKSLSYIIRTNKDNSVNYIKVAIDKIVPNSPSDVIMQDSDRIIIFSKRDIKDIKRVRIAGAVREAGSYPYSEDIKVRDLLNLASGLTPEATDFAYIERFNPKNTNEKQYIRINIEEIARDSNAKDNIKLQPDDIVTTYSNLVYTNTSEVKVEGAVNKPSKYQYAKGLTINDLLLLSGGFKEEASPKKVDVYRVLIQENEPTKTLALSIGFDRNFNVISGDIKAEVQPYDIIVVRSVPDFELQQVVYISGEVTYPGSYALVSKNEKIVSIIARAGGLTSEGFPSGTRITRVRDELGAVIVRLDEAIKNPNSNNNIVLKNGDNIYIPKTKDLVSIHTFGTKSYEVNVQKDTIISVPFFAGKNAKFYIEQYTGGLYRDKTIKWKDVYVESPNGKILRSKNYFFYKTFPKVDIGSSIKVAVVTKPQKEETKKQRDPEAFEKTLQRTTMIATLATVVIGLLNVIKSF